jgi:hypothetical protein
MGNNAHNQQAIKELAKYMAANPTKKVTEIVSVFCSKYGKCERTIFRWVEAAKRMNAAIDTINEEKAQHAVFKNPAVQRKVDDYCNVIVSRTAILTQLRSIMNDLDATAGEKIRAMDLAAKMEGFYAPTKTAITDSIGNDIDPPLNDIAVFLKRQNR